MLLNIKTIYYFRERLMSSGREESPPPGIDMSKKDQKEYSGVVGSQTKNDLFPFLVSKIVLCCTAGTVSEKTVRGCSVCAKMSHLEF